MKARQIAILIQRIDISWVAPETKRLWENLVGAAMSETDGDAAFERLRRRFEKSYAVLHHSGLGGCTSPVSGGGCTAPLVAA